jgi:AAA domain
MRPSEIDVDEYFAEMARNNPDLAKRHGYKVEDSGHVIRFRDAPAPTSAELETVVASSLKMRSIRWLWPGRFAIGKLGLIGGLPDKGKGLISCSLIASVTAGAPLPCKEGLTPQGDVIWLTAEDDIVRHDYSSPEERGGRSRSGSHRQDDARRRQAANVQLGYRP